MNSTSKILALGVVYLAILTSTAFNVSPSIRIRSQSSFLMSSLTPGDYIRLTKEYLADPSADKLADDFVFRGPVVGPLVKKDIQNSIKGVASDIKTAFPDMEQNAFGFSCDDPIEPTRVWYFVRPRATFKGSFKTGLGKVIQPTGKKLIGPPEARSLLFNAEGKIKYQSVGYVTDRFTGDTTAGKGAVFGLYEVIGQSLDGSVGGKVMGILQKVSSKLPEGILPKSFSNEADIPSWWTDKRRGNEA